MAKREVKEEDKGDKMVEKKVIDSDLIWDEIKGRKLDIFALDGQTVEKYFSKKAALPESLILKYKVSGAIPSLEESLKDTFDIELLDGGYVSVSRVQKKYSDDE
jgi:hypothetical protein